MTRIHSIQHEPAAPLSSASPLGFAAGAGAESVVAELADHTSQYYLGLSRQLAALTRLSAGGTLAVGLTTSASRREGVSSVAVNLASAASHDIGGRVLLVDANFDSPCSAEAAGGRRGPGLADLVLNPAMELTECLQNASVPNLDVLTAGTSAARSELSVSADRVRPLLMRLADNYQLVVFDLPVASELTACFALARCLDGVVLVVEAERTRSKAVARAEKQLLQSGADVLGVVLNRRREHVPGWIYHRV